MSLIISIPLALTQIVLFQGWPFTLWTKSAWFQSVLILWDFWPLEKLASWAPTLNLQPWRGLVLSAMVALLVTAVWVDFIGLAHWDLVVFIVRVCVAAIFGIFVLLEPLRELVLCAGAVLLAMALYAPYQAAATLRFGLAGGAPHYTLELWIASAMLAITFTLMVAFAEYFAFWSIARAQR
jgi:hypothetical protein